MLEIDLVNIQAIEEAHIVITENTITEFVGNNSNGKSIVTKSIEYLTKGDLIHRDVRDALMKDGTEQSVIMFTYGFKQLGIILKRELKDCIAMYVPDMRKAEQPGGRVLLPLGDSDGIAHLVRAFGFRTYAKGDICLQLAPTFGAIPFVTTSGSVNSDIVSDITTDKVADEFITSFSTITFPAFKNTLKRYRSEREHLQMVIDSMESYDWHAYEALAEEMHKVYMCINSYAYTQISEIEIPYLNVVPVSAVKIHEIPIVSFCDYAPVIFPIGVELDEYLQISKGICPTCGKPFFD